MAVTAPEAPPIISAPLSGGTGAPPRLTREQRFEAAVNQGVENIIAGFNNGEKLLDSGDLDRISRASGLDALNKSERRSVRFIKAGMEREAAKTAQIAMQEAALMGAENGGELSKDDLKYLMSKYGKSMQTHSTKLAKTTDALLIAGGAGAGFLGGFLTNLKNKDVGVGATMGAIAGGVIGFLVPFPGATIFGACIGMSLCGMAQGLAEPVMKGVAAAVGGGAIAKALSFGAEKLGFMRDDHSKELENALRKAAARGHEIAEEHNLDISRKTARGRAPAKEAAPAAAPTGPTVDPVVAASLEASEKVVARIGDKHPALKDILEGTSSGMKFAEMAPSTQDAIINEIKAAKDDPNAALVADILTTVKSGEKYKGGYTAESAAAMLNSKLAAKPAPSKEAGPETVLEVNAPLVPRSPDLPGEQRTKH